MRNLKTLLTLSGFIAALTIYVCAAPPSRAAATNLALSATATASTSWEDGTDFGGAKTNDNDPTTRWNARTDDLNGSWLQLDWTSAVTFNKVEIDEDFNRVTQYQLQIPSGSDWKTIYDSVGTNVNPSASQTPVHIVAFNSPVTAKSLRAVFVQATAVVSIFEFKVFDVDLGTIKGMVMDATGAAISGATVTVGNASTTTDASGNYSLTVEAATVDVTATKVGVFRSHSALNVAIPANSTVTQDFTLTALPTNLALTATADASTYYASDDTYGPAKIIDGDLTTRWNSDNGDVTDSWVELTWKTAQTFNSITIREALGRIKTYSIQTFDTTINDYKDVVTEDVTSTSGKEADRTLVVILPTSLTTKDLRILITDATNLPSIWELEVSQTPLGIIKGVVQDVTTGKAIAGASATIDPGGTVTTDAQGAFQMTIGPDDYRVSASATGYFPGTTQVVSVNADQTSSVTISLPAQGDNLALKAQASASLEGDGYPATNVNDGDSTTSWQTDALDPADTKNQWVALTFDKATTFNVVKLSGFIGVIQKSVIQVLGTDGKTWTDVPNTSINPETLALTNSPALLILDSPVTTTSVRYFIYYTNGNANVPGVSEFELYDSPIGQTAPTATLGDINADGKVNVQDATLSLRIAVGLLTPSDAQKTADDVNKDGKTNIQDTTLILQVAVGVKTGF